MIVGWQRAKNGLPNAGLRALVFALLSAPAAVSAADTSSATSFIKTSGTDFTVDGRPFFVTGVNNHYLTFGSQDEVTRVLDDAMAMGANVVRTFLQPVIGSLDGSIATIWKWRMRPMPAISRSETRTCSTGTRAKTGWRLMTVRTACRRLISSSPRPASDA
jgi:mannan endo-1,4-beta-mannosidase